LRAALPIAIAEDADEPQSFTLRNPNRQGIALLKGRWADLKKRLVN
jgi:hypothetical protein